MNNIKRKTMFITIIIFMIMILSSCKSLPPEIKILEEKEVLKIAILNKVKPYKLEYYKINILSYNDDYFFCLNDSNFKIVGNNDNKKDLYIIELENQLEYYKSVIKRHNEG